MEIERTDNSNSDFFQKSTKPTKFNEVTGLSEEEVTPQQLAKSSYFQEIFNEEELDVIQSSLSETKVNYSSSPNVWLWHHRVKCSIPVIQMFLPVPLEARKRKIVHWQHSVGAVSRNGHSICILQTTMSGFLAKYTLAHLYPTVLFLVENPFMHLMWAYWNARRRTLYRDSGNPHTLNFKITSASSVSSSKKKGFTTAWIKTWLWMLECKL